MPFDPARATAPQTTTPGVGEFDKPDTSYLSTLSAAFRQDNIIGSSFSDARRNVTDGLWRNDPNYNVYHDPEMKDYVSAYPTQFEDVYNKQMADAVRANIDKEKTDKATLSASGWVPWLVSEGLANVLDPTILIPGGALGQEAKVGFKIGKSALSIGAAAGLSTAVQEAGLQATQETRPLSSSIGAIGGSVLLGGLLGAGAAKFLSHSEWGRVSKSLEESLTGETPDPVGLTDTIVKRMQAAGAQSVDQIKLDDLGVGGPKIAKAVAKATAAARINPGIQTMLSPSKTVRETYNKLVDNPIYTKMNMEGDSLGPAVENLVKMYERGALSDWLSSSRDLFRQAKKAGYEGTKADFYDAVTMAGRRGDIDPGGNEFITKAAQDARSKVYDPLLERAKQAGLLPDDVGVTTAKSYVTRMWNRTRLIGEEQRFKDIATQWMTGAVKKRVEDMTSARDARIGHLTGIANDLELPAEQRTALLGDLAQQAKAHSEGSPHFVATDEELSGLRSQLATAKKAGNKPAAEGFAKQIEETSAKAGKDYADYVTKRNALQSRLSRVRNNIAGRAGQVEAIKSRIADVEAANVNRLRRMHSVLTNLEKEVDRNSPEVLAEKLSMARTQFAQVLERSNAAQERLAKTRERLAEEPGKLDQAEMAFDSTEAKRLADISERADRIAELEKIDPEEALTELQGLIQSRLEQSAELVEREGARLVELSKKLGDADPKLVKDRVEGIKKRIKEIERDFHDKVDIGLGGQNDFKDYVKDAVNGIYDNLTGRGHGDVPDWIVPARQGPLKERTFNIPDAKVEDFLENDSEVVLRRYVRKMAPEVELADKFGRPDMKDQFDAIKHEYDDLRQQIALTEDQKKLPAAKQEKLLAAAREKLVAQEKRDTENLAAFRDLVRGTYRAAEEGSDWSKLTRTALLWNYLRLLGGVTLASLTDASRFVAVHGMRATMNEAIPALVKGVKAAQISRQDAKDLGAVTERVLQSRLASLSEINDPYAHGSAFERFMSNTSNVFSKATGLGWWNDTLKTMASVMTQNRMMRNILNASKVEHIPESVYHNASYSGEIAIRHGFNKSGKRTGVPPKLERNFAGERYDANSFGNEGVYLDSTGHWTEPGPNANFGVGEFAAGKAKFKNALLVTPQTIGSLREKINVPHRAELGTNADQMVGRDVADYARKNGYDGIIVTGFDGKAIKSLEDEQALAKRFRTHESVLQDQAFAFDPESIKFDQKTFMPGDKGIPPLPGIGDEVTKKVTPAKTVERIDYGRIKPAEKAYMGYLGIDEQMAQRIADQFKKYGMQEDGIYGANVSKWDDQVAARAWAAALNKDVDRTIVAPGVADRPLWMRTNWGKLIMQFKSFSLASHQRVLIAGLQERPHRFAEQIVGATGLGMLISWLKYKERGDDQEAAALLQNPGNWVANGLDRSGIFSIPFDVTNTLDKVSSSMGGRNLSFAYAASKIAGDPSSQGQIARYASRDPIGAVLGPTAGIFSDLATISAQLSQGGLKKSGVNAMIRQVPGGTLPLIRSALHIGLAPALGTQ